MKTLTQSEIENGFRDIGLSEGMFLEVHSSLSSFGHVEGGANAVIHALMNVIGRSGAIIMATFPVSLPMPLLDIDVQRGLTYKTKIFDEASDERSGMGVISDTFRKMPGVLTGKGVRRVSAWGKDADKNSKGLTNLIENDGHALLIGVDIYRLTSMHYMESKLPDEVRQIFEPPEEIKKYYPEDQWYIETGHPPVQAWYKIQNEAYKRGLIRDKLIGKSKCMFFKVNDVIRIYEKAIETDPLGLYGLK